MASTAPLRISSPFHVDARHARLRRERNKLHFVRAQFAPAQSVTFLSEDDDRTAFRRFVRQRGKLCGVGQFRITHARSGNEFGGLAIAECDGASLVEQQRVHIAGSFDGAARHRQNVVLNQTIHARDSDGREQAADGRRNQAYQQRDQHKDRLRRAGVDGERLQSNHRQQKDDRQPREQNIQCDLVRSLLPLGALDQRDHAIQKCFAGIRRDLYADLIGENARAAGDCRAVASGLRESRARILR